LALTVVGGTLLSAITSAEENQVIFRGGLPWRPATELRRLHRPLVHDWLYRRRSGWYSGAELERATHKNFLSVKGMTQITMMTVDVPPKLKFSEGSKIRL